MTAIEWTDATWNPVTGCSKVSPGCAHCYAETLSHRWRRTTKPWTPENAAENVRLHPDRLAKPLSWRKPRMVFVNSMSDLFHEEVPDAFIDDVFATMLAAPQHTFQVLTKRPGRAQEWFGSCVSSHRLERTEATMTAGYVTGERCAVCGYWFWEEDGHWHSLVPIQYADAPEKGRRVFCPRHLSAEPPTDADILRGEELARTHGWFGPPPNVIDGSIGDLPCEIVDTKEGRYVYSVWELSDADRQAIANGCNLRLGVGWIGGYPPTSLGVTQEQALDGEEPAS